MNAIFKRELRSYFHGMLGYLLTAFLLASSGIYFLALNLGYGLTAGVVIYDESNYPEKTICNVPVVANKKSMLDYIQNHIVDEIFLDLKEKGKLTERLVDIFINMGLTVHMNLMPYDFNMEERRVHSFGNYMVMTTSMKFASPWQVLAKRMLDICGALVGLVLTGIAIVIFGPIIKKQSPGPILFSQKRVGRNGRIFNIYKIRTMYPDAEERKKELMGKNKMSGLMFKMDNDPRIFPIGHFLRKTSIDELPQFWNVLIGDMSLVGTRPPTVDEYEQYEIGHRKRLTILGQNMEKLTVYELLLLYMSAYLHDSAMALPDWEYKVLKAVEGTEEYHDNTLEFTICNDYKPKHMLVNAKPLLLNMRF